LLYAFPVTDQQPNMGNKMNTMKTIFNVAVLALALNLAACAKDDHKKSDGKAGQENLPSNKCSDTVTNEFAGMIKLARAYEQLKEAGNTEQAIEVGQQLTEKCTSFVEEHGEVRCKATIGSDSGPVDGSLIRKDCDQLKKMLKEQGA
jgi:hypothetical protein